MNSLTEISNKIIEQVQLLTLKDVTDNNIAININVDSSKQHFGDISTNAPLVVSKIVQENPILIAQKIKEGIKSNFIERIEIAGAGFLNIFLTVQALQNLALILDQEKENFFLIDTKDRINYSDEFVSANPTGPLHIGHGRGGIIGDVLGNILKFIGNKVTKEFYVNDAGVQINKLGISLKSRYMQELSLEQNFPEDGYHGEYLIEIAKQLVSSSGKDLLEKSDYWFSQYAKDQLLSKIQDTLELYGINYDVWFSELTLHEDGSIIKAIDILKKHNYLYEKDNALWFKSTNFGDDKDRVIQKQSGELTYVAADIAYIINKLERGAQKLIYVLGQDHHSYVTRLKSVAQALGYSADIIEVILYQLVTLKEDGQALRMSKRAGRIVTLLDLIETVGTDCARFFYLNKKADAHLDFDVALALTKSDENPVYYVQYAYVRASSILRKAQDISELRNLEATDYQYIGIEEKLLIKKIISLRELLISISKNYQVHLVTYYVIELSKIFHSYYNANKVINTTEINQTKGRLFVIKLLKANLKLCFDILGISSPESM